MLQLRQCLPWFVWALVPRRVKSTFPVVQGSASESIGPGCASWWGAREQGGISTSVPSAAPAHLSSQGSVCLVYLHRGSPVLYPFTFQMTSYIVRLQVFPFTVHNFSTERFFWPYILFKLYLTVLGKYCLCLCIIYSCSSAFLFFLFHWLGALMFMSSICSTWDKNPLPSAYITTLIISFCLQIGACFYYVNNILLWCWAKTKFTTMFINIYSHLFPGLVYPMFWNTPGKPCCILDNLMSDIPDNLHSWYGVVAIKKRYFTFYLTGGFFVLCLMQISVS